MSKIQPDGYRSFVDLNFKVTPAFHFRFRLEAALRNVSMKELMESAFKCFLDNHGDMLEQQLLHTSPLPADNGQKPR